MRQKGDAANSDVPQRTTKVLPLTKMVQVLYLMRKEKKWYAEVAEIYSKDESSIHEMVKKEKEICASFTVAPQCGVISTLLRWKRCKICTVRYFERETTFTKLLYQYIVIIALFYCYYSYSLTVPINHF